MSEELRCATAFASPVDARVDRTVSKIGGSPVGMPSEFWPHCKECGRRMDFLFQLDLHSPIQLAKRYQHAYFFMCHGYIDEFEGRQCATYYPTTGANKIVLVETVSMNSEPAEKGMKIWPEFLFDFTEQPAEQDPSDEEIAAEIISLLESGRPAGRVTVTLEGDDMTIILPDRQERQRRVLQVGGEPQWVQSDETPVCPACGGSMRFLAQLDGIIREYFDNGGVFMPFGGGDGVAFGFICDAECCSEGTYLMWQCG